MTFERLNNFMQEDLDAAILAAQTNGAMKQWYGPQRSRIDPRQFVGHHPPQQNYGYPPQQNHGGYNPNIADGYDVPQTVPAQQIRTLPMVIRGKDGKLIDLNQVLEPQEQSQPQSNVESFQGFQMPNYSDDSSSRSKKKNIQQEHPFDVILKEIKSLKKSVNKLIRDLDASKLSKDQTKTINEVTSKSTDISERISDSSFGDE